MRVTFGQLRRAARDPSFRIVPGQRSGGPNTAGTLRAAVRAYHRNDESAAHVALEQGLSRYFAKRENRQAADRARRMLRRYIALAETDGRPAFDYDVAGDLVIGDDVVAVSVDLALLDPNGYAGRVVLWDQLPCDRGAALVICGPAYDILAADLGTDRVDNVEVWHMPTPARFAFTAAEAIEGSARVPGLLARIRPEEEEAT
jgi:hypothetical protein